MFDPKERAKISAKKKLATIAELHEAAHGVAPIRGYFKCDQSKILREKRLGIRKRLESTPLLIIGIMVENKQSA